MDSTLYIADFRLYYDQKVKLYKPEKNQHLCVPYYFTKPCEYVTHTLYVPTRTLHTNNNPS